MTIDLKKATDDLAAQVKLEADTSTAKTATVQRLRQHELDAIHKGMNGNPLSLVGPRTGIGLLIVCGRDCSMRSGYGAGIGGLGKDERLSRATNRSEQDGKDLISAHLKRSCE